MQATRKKKG